MMRNVFPLIIILISACLSCRQGTEGTESDRNYILAYNIHVPDTAKDDWEILTMNLDGTNRKNITNHPDVAWTYLAHKDRLFFISDRDTAYRHYYLYEMNVNGGGVRKVSDLRLEDSWMSSRNDGNELIVAGRIGNEVRYQLFSINTVTGVYQQLTSDTSAYHSDPCFSPDGRKIVFSYKKNRRDRSIHEELYIMNADGTEMKQLTQYPENNPSANEYGYRAGSARWHPTENFITYVSRQDGKNGIYAVTPDGSRKWKLIEYELNEGWHDWSSDGKWLAFNSSDLEEKQYHITLVNWLTKEQKQLTDNTYKSQLGPVFVEL